MSQTIKNLEAAFAGESQAYTKYLYFARLADKQGLFKIADKFYEIAEQELKHAHAHLELLVGEPEVETSIQMAIDGETYEYTVMYPEFARQARLEGDTIARELAEDQIRDSAEHAEQFRELLATANELLATATKRFQALAKIERRHAQYYENLLREAANDE